MVPGRGTKKGGATRKYTSAQANNLLQKLNDEYSALLDKERRSRDFRAAKTLTGLSVYLNGARPRRAVNTSISAWQAI